MNSLHALFFAISAALPFQAFAVEPVIPGPTTTGRDSSDVSDAKAREKASYHWVSQVVMFEPGSAVLTPAGQQKLNKLIDNSRASEVERVVVAAWSDKAFPQNPDQLYTKVDSTLASERAKTVEDYIANNSRVTSLGISKYNMAEEPNKLSKFFGTEEAVLKSGLSKKGDESPSSAVKEEIDVIKRDGRAKTAVVVMKLRTIRP